jgi:hypothetical protein
VKSDKGSRGAADSLALCVISVISVLKLEVIGVRRFLAGAFRWGMKKARLGAGLEGCAEVDAVQCFALSIFMP